jgi:hypothetical protein
MRDELFLENFLTGERIAWGRHEVAVIRKFRGTVVVTDPVLFKTLRRARIKAPHGPEGRMSSVQWAKLLSGLDRFDRIRVERAAKDGRIEPVEVLEESRKLPDGWKIVERT